MLYCNVFGWGLIKSIQFNKKDVNAKNLYSAFKSRSHFNSKTFHQKYMFLSLWVQFSKIFTFNWKIIWIVYYALPTKSFVINEIENGFQLKRKIIYLTRWIRFFFLCWWLLFVGLWIFPEFWFSWNTNKIDLKIAIFVFNILDFTSKM